MRVKTFFIRIFFCLCIGFLAQDVLAAKEKKIDQSLRRHISLSIQMRNLYPTLLSVAGLSIYGPVKNTPAQECISLTANYPFTKTTDAAGNQLLQFDFKDFPAFENRIVTVQAEIALRDEQLKTTEKVAKQYLLPEVYIESQAPEIKALAEKLKKTNSIATARAMHAWVTENIKYAGYTKNPQGALWALRKRRGDCTEYMYLFVALCRAAGIPARGVTGFATGSNGRLQPESFHDWAEFYADGQWQLADPQKKNFMNKQNQYLAFKIQHASGKNANPGFSLFRSEGQGIKAVMK